MGYDKDHPAMTQHTKLLTDKHTQSGAKCRALYDASKRNAASSNKREGKDRCAPCYELDDQQSQIRRAPNPTDLVSGSEGGGENRPCRVGGEEGVDQALQRPGKLMFYGRSAYDRFSPPFGLQVLRPAHREPSQWPRKPTRSGQLLWPSRRT